MPGGMSMKQIADLIDKYGGQFNKKPGVAGNIRPPGGADFPPPRLPGGPDKPGKKRKKGPYVGVPVGGPNRPSPPGGWDKPPKMGRY